MTINRKGLSPRGKQGCFFAGCFLFFAFIMWCAPYSSDDIAFGVLSFDTPAGYLDYALRYGNGRLLGNLCATLLCHSKLLAVVVKAGVLASSVMVLPKLLDCDDAAGYGLSFLLFTLIEPAVFGEVYVWTSGFSNYMPPIWLTLVILCILKKDTCAPPVNALRCLLVLLLAVCSQLFIEHSSGVNLLLSAAFAVYAFRRKKQSRWAGLCWVLGTAMGLGLMLWIPRLFYTAGNVVESYRSMNLGSVKTLVYSVAKNAIQLFGGHWFGACLLAACAGSLACLWQTRKAWSPKALRRLLLPTLGAMGYLLLSMALATITYRGKSAVLEHGIECLAVAIPVVTWAIAAWKLPTPLRGRVLGCLVFAAASLAPLLVVTPIPTRVIYQSYVFVLMGALLSCHPILAGLTGKWKAAAGKALAGAMVCLVVIIGSVFASVRFMVTLRENYVRQCIAQGQTTIDIFQLPYTYTSWDHLWSQGRYWGQLTDAELTFETDGFDNWMHQHWVLD